MTAGTGMTGGGTSGNVTVNFDSTYGDGRYVKKSGDTMTGALTLNADPTTAFGAATKQYVDNLNANKVSKSGDTMTGYLTLIGAPTLANQAATKKYVDDSVASAGGGDITGVTAGTGLTGGGLTGDVTVSLGSTYVDGSAYDSRFVNVGGDSMTGMLTLIGNPTTAMQAATKQYVDNAVASVGGNYVYRSGDTMTGALGLPDMDLEVYAPGSIFKGSMKSYNSQSSNNVFLQMTDPSNRTIRFFDANSNIQLFSAGTSYVPNLRSNYQGETEFDISNKNTAYDGYAAYAKESIGLVSPNKHTETYIGERNNTVGKSYGIDVTANTSDAMAGQFVGGGGYVKLADNSTSRVVDISGNICLNSSCINAWPSGGGGTITGVTAGTGITGGGTSGNVSVALNTTYTDGLYVNTAGDTMTGALVLNANPTAALGAATKQYVDAADTAKVSKTGDTMTGTLTVANAGLTNGGIFEGTWQGVIGRAKAAGGVGVQGSGTVATNYGEVGGDGFGVRGYGSTYGVFGQNSTAGTINGYLGGTSYGAYGTNGSVYGYLGGASYSVFGTGGAYGIHTDGTTMGGYFKDTDNGTYTYIAYGGYGMYTPYDVYIGGALSVVGTASKTGGGSWAVYSDSRLKDVQSNYTKGLDEISALQPIYYNYKPGNALNLPSDNTYVGFVAQDVKDVIPEAVTKDSNGYLQINNDPIIWAMVNSIKELKAQNDQLKARVDALEKK